MTFGAASLLLYVTLSYGTCRTSVGRLLEDSVWASGYSHMSLIENLRLRGSVPYEALG